jgi:hypothetical protein
VKRTSVAPAAVKISPATSRILKQRMKTADEGRLVSADKARERSGAGLQGPLDRPSWHSSRKTSSISMRRDAGEPARVLAGQPGTPGE